MNIEFINASDINDSWFQALTKIFESGRVYRIDTGSYAGQQRLEFDYITIRISHPATRPLLPKIPLHLGIPDPASEEYLYEYLPYLMADHKESNEDYSYGAHLERQIAKIISIYKSSGPNNNQCCMMIGTPDSVFLNDPECLRIIDTRISYGKLNFIVYFRSNDLWAGYPVNIASIQLLKEYMALEIGVDDGEVIYSSKGLHLYDHCWGLAKTRIGKK